MSMAGGSRCKSSVAVELAMALVRPDEYEEQIQIAFQQASAYLNGGIQGAKRHSLAKFDKESVPGAHRRPK